jgi:coenzyme F420-reducing hydrogenase delta subunit
MRHLATGTPAERPSACAAVATFDDFQPAMTAFCCSRSAFQAASLAVCLGHSLPPGLKIIQVPCAGAISTGDLLNAFQNNADGVLVLTCHTGNCHAEEGNHHAHRRVAEARMALVRIGLNKERLLRSTLAANMSAEFVDTITCFADTLKRMGPALNR